MDRSECIINEPGKEHTIWYQSLGKHLYDCLQAREPDDIIAIDAVTKKTLSCGELLQKSVKLSIALRRLSIAKGDVVALITENNLLNYVIACASLYNGLQLNLLNFAYTFDELKHVFEISKPRVVFCSRTALRAVLSVREVFDFVQEVVLIEPDESLALQNVENLIKDVKFVENFEIEAVNLEDTAILCLSSGTTGLPKCVEITHKSFLPLINNASSVRHFHVTDLDVTVLVLPFFHVYGLEIHLLAITNSMKVISMKSFKPEVFLQAIEEYGATKLFIPPPILQFLVNSPIVSKYNMTSLKDMILGAAPLKPDLFEDALNKFKYCTIRQVYGSTETAGIAIQHPTDKFSSAGKILSNTSLKVIDTNTGLLLGPHKHGEICVKSTTLLKSYLNDPSATAEAIDQDGFYHTGDIGYYDNDKNIYVIDRLKEVIKYKGFQVPPAEVENLLLIHPDVNDCGVVGLPDDRCGQLPLAFVIRREGSTITEQDLVKFVAGKISIQKQLHGGVRFIDKIPKSSSGKILRKELIKILFEE